MLRLLPATGIMMGGVLVCLLAILKTIKKNKEVMGEELYDKIYYLSYGIMICILVFGMLVNLKIVK